MTNNLSEQGEGGSHQPDKVRKALFNENKRKFTDCGVIYFFMLCRMICRSPQMVKIPFTPLHLFWANYFVTVDGRNSAPVDMENLPLFTGVLYISGGASPEFWSNHQQYMSLIMDLSRISTLTFQGVEFRLRFFKRLEPENQSHPCYFCWMYYILRPAAAGVAKLAARDAQLRVQMLLF